jgi:uncharacterized protein (DUF1810 family)
MPSAQEELARLNWLIKEGQVMPEEPCKIILPRIAAKERAKNAPNAQGQRRTKLIKQLDSPETYSEFEIQFSRYKECAGNVQIAFTLMLEVLAALPDESIKRMAANSGEESRELRRKMR